MNGTEVGGDLVMREKATFKEVVLTAAKIGGWLDMNGSTFDGKLTMEGTEVGQHLLMGETATFREVVLTAAKVGGRLAMNGSTFHDMLTMEGTEVGQHLLMGEKATLKEVVLTAAKIGGWLDMNGSTFDGKLTMYGTEVGGDLSARSTRFPMDQEVILHFARIGSSLDLCGATIATIDLTATTVAGELRLGSAEGYEPTNWVGASRMILRNTTVGAIQDADVETKCWPETMELEGFAYGRLGGLGAMDSADMAKRDNEWFIQWLERDETYSPQTYEQLATLLRESGYPSKANAILFAGRQRARRAARRQRERLRWIGMVLQEYTIGYGLGGRYFRAIPWVLFVTAIGVIVFVTSLPAEQVALPVWLGGGHPVDAGMVASAATTAVPSQERMDIYDLLWASFDQVLPIIELDETHKEMVTAPSLPWWARYYFYFQKLVGWVLGSFLIAGLAGLTQKS